MVLRDRRAEAGAARDSAASAEHGPRHLSAARRRQRTAALTPAAHPLPPARGSAVGHAARLLLLHGIRRSVRDRGRPAVSAASPAGARHRLGLHRRSHADRERRLRGRAHRGYPHMGALWSPGFASIELRAMEAAGIAASTERVGNNAGADARPGAGRRARAAVAVHRKRRRHGYGRLRAGPGGRPVRHYARRAASRKPRARTPPATRRAPSSPATIGSPTGAATR